MIELDASQLAPEVAGLFLSGGAELPGLQWQARPKQFAKDRLDEIEDAKLLGRAAPGDEAMTVAVRALLYLWNGWPVEAAMVAQAAAEPECHYLTGFCERQLGRADRAKAALQQLADYPIYAPLAQYAIKTIGEATEPLLKRFKGLMELGETWEPFLFVDLVEQVRAGKFDRDAEIIVRRLQCREFELLFRHCYEQATGEPIPARVEPESTADREARLRRLRHKRERKRPDRLARREPSAQEEKPSSGQRPGEAEPATVNIGCPQCGQVLAFPQSTRGRNGNCGKCGAVFLIPQRQTPELRPTPQAPACTVAVGCPKCGQMVRRAESDRGKTHKCSKCGTVFLIPKK